jgi:hypothetical protein
MGRKQPLRLTAGGDGGLRPLIVFIDACSVVAHYAAAANSPAVLPEWRDLATTTLDAFVSLAIEHNCDLVVESKVIGGLLQERFAERLERVDIEMALPNFAGAGLVAPGDLMYLGNSTRLALFVPHPSAHLRNAEIDAAFRAQVRTHHKVRVRRLGADHGPLTRRVCWWQACMLQQQQPEAMQRVYDPILDDSERKRYMGICVALKNEDPDLYANLLVRFHGPGRAAVRRLLFKRLDRCAAAACLAFLSDGASRWHASAVALCGKLTLDDVAKLLRCVSSANDRVRQVWGHARKQRKPPF